MVTMRKFNNDILTRKNMSFWNFLSETFLLLLVLPKLTGQAEAVVWREEQEVGYYSDFSSVMPTRFVVPHDQLKAVWKFSASKLPDSCEEKTLRIYLQFGSLPVVNPQDEEFPDKFYLGRSHLSDLNVTSNNVSVPLVQHLPQPGDWYAIAFIPETSTEIKQKGLSVSCAYKFSVSMETQEIPAYLHVNVNKGWQVELTGAPEGEGLWVGFKVPTTALSVKFAVSNCSLADCRLQLTGWDDLTGQPVIANCTAVDNTTCVVDFVSPLVGTPRFLHLLLLSPGNATAQVYVETQDCSEEAPVTGGSNDTLSCRLEPKLDRYQEQADFTTSFVRIQNDTVLKDHYALSNTSVTVVPFTIQRVTDVGGTLRIKVAFKKEDVAEEQSVRVCGQVQVNRFPGSLDTDLDLCVNGSNSVQVNSSLAGEDGSVTDRVYVPYPQQGLWMLALSLQCYSATNSSDQVAVACSNGTQNVTVEVRLDSCLDGGCNGQGVCKEYIRSSDFIVYSTCRCTAGWRGYACTDGREALSASSQLVEVLLLTLSNLFFIPAILVALHRRHYIEAIVYFYTMFFSTFYHACDGDRIDKYMYCMTKYSVLAIGDFLASTCSLWVTIVAMARVPLDYSSAAQMAAPLALIVGVLLDRHSLWVIAVPTAVGLLLVAVSWVRQGCRGKRCFPETQRYLWMLPGLLEENSISQISQFSCLFTSVGVTRCCRGRRCFPEKRRYLWMLPGVLFAVAGVVTFAFFETTKNYKYTHSVWHMCLSLCIIFLLPPRRKQKVVTSVNFDETESTEGLVLGAPHNYNRTMYFDL